MTLSKSWGKGSKVEKVHILNLCKFSDKGDLKAMKEVFKHLTQKVPKK